MPQLTSLLYHPCSLKKYNGLFRPPKDDCLQPWSLDPERWIRSDHQRYLIWISKLPTLLDLGHHGFHVVCISKRNGNRNIKNSPTCICGCLTWNNDSNYIFKATVLGSGVLNFLIARLPGDADRPCGDSVYISYIYICISFIHYFSLVFSWSAAGRVNVLVRVLLRCGAERAVHMEDIGVAQVLWYDFKLPYQI